MKKTDTNKNLSNILFIAKAFAIITVAAAHCSYGDDEIQKITTLIGKIGVPVFLILSGYFLNCQELVANFIKKKTKRIVVPWLFWGIVTYIIAVLVGTKISINVFLEWILGVGTWLYYVPLYLFCIVFFRIFNKQYQLVLCIIVTFISVEIFEGNLFILSKYQNPLNWIGFFSLGIILKKHNLIDKYFKSRLLRISAWSGTLMLSLVFLCFIKNPSYWSGLGIVFETLSFFVFLDISSLMYKSKVLIEIGRISYFIYFSHMQIGNIIINRIIGNLIYQGGIHGLLLCIVRPVMVVGIVFLLALVVRVSCQKLKMDKFLWVVGL